VITGILNAVAVGLAGLGLAVAKLSAGLGVLAHSFVMLLKDVFIG
jgi:hypothetical protein